MGRKSSHGASWSEARLSIFKAPHRRHTNIAWLLANWYQNIVTELVFVKPQLSGACSVTHRFSELVACMRRLGAILIQVPQRQAKVCPAPNNADMSRRLKLRSDLEIIWGCATHFRKID